MRKCATVEVSLVIEIDLSDVPTGEDVAEFVRNSFLDYEYNSYAKVIDEYEEED